MKKDIKLIEGTFKESEALDIILSMINKKIEFHELNSFSNLVKLNKQDDQLQKRIEVLNEERQNFIKFIELNKNREFKITSEINIEAL